MLPVLLALPCSAPAGLPGCFLPAAERGPGGASPVGRRLPAAGGRELVSCASKSRRCYAAARAACMTCQEELLGWTAKSGLACPWQPFWNACFSGAKRAFYALAVDAAKESGGPGLPLHGSIDGGGGRGTLGVLATCLIFVVVLLYFQVYSFYAPLLRFVSSITR